MLNILGFNFYTEQTKDGQWTGYGTNGTVKLPTMTAPSFIELQAKFEGQAVVYQCQADMGSSWMVTLDDDEIVYVNLPCQNLSTEIAQLDIDYHQAKTDIFNGRFNGKKAQYRIKIETFKHYALGKVIGIYTEPNLLQV